MKKHVLHFKLLLVAFLALLGDVKEAIAQAPIQEFRFNNSRTNQAGNISFANNAFIGFTTDRFGNANSALQVNNNGTTATIPGLPYGNSARSFSIWVKSTTNTFGHIYSYGTTLGQNAFTMENNAVSHTGNTGNAFHQITDTRGLNAWNHYVIIYAANNSKIYKNGALVSQSFFMDINTVSASDVFNLGISVNNSLSFTGALDDLQIYNREISAQEVLALYTSTSPIQSYSFDNTYANTNGSFPFGSNASTSFVNDRFGYANSAMSLNNGFVSSTIEFLPLNNSPRTVSMWVRMNNALPTDGTYHAFFSYGTSTNYWETLINASEIHSAYQFASHIAMTPSTANVWNHFIFTYDGTLSRIYRNGALISTSNPYNTNNSNRVNTLNSNSLFTLGRRASISFTNPFRGIIDDMKIYNRALSDVEVTALYGSESLPLTLSQFNGIVDKGTALLNWQTSQEQNTSHFEIEHSVSGNNFMKVVQEQASENSTSIRNYKTEHKPLRNSVHFYRLKMVDKDGKFTYSQVLKLEDDRVEETLSVYPSVTANHTTLSIQSKERKHINISILSTTGYVYRQYSLTLQQGTNTQSIGLENMAAGTYLIQVKSEKEVKVLKVVKQ